MMTDVNYTYYGDHFAVYTNTEPLCCTPEINICQLNLKKDIEWISPEKLGGESQNVRLSHIYATLDGSS